MTGRDINLTWTSIPKRKQAKYSACHIQTRYQTCCLFCQSVSLCQFGNKCLYLLLRYFMTIYQPPSCIVVNPLHKKFCKFCKHFQDIQVIWITLHELLIQAYKAVISRESELIFISSSFPLLYEWRGWKQLYFTAPRTSAR